MLLEGVFVGIVVLPARVRLLLTNTSAILIIVGDLLTIEGVGDEELGVVLRDLLLASVST